MKATEDSSPYGLCVVNNELYYSDVKRRQICIIDLEQEQVTSTVIAGNGDAKRAYGLSLKSSFGQPSAMACEEKSIFVCDTGANAVALVTPLEPLGIICQKLGHLHDAFSIHVPKNHPRKMFLRPYLFLEMY